MTIRWRQMTLPHRLAWRWLGAVGVKESISLVSLPWQQHRWHTPGAGMDVRWEVRAHESDHTQIGDADRPGNPPTCLLGSFRS